MKNRCSRNTFGQFRNICYQLSDTVRWLRTNTVKRSEMQIIMLMWKNTCRLRNDIYFTRNFFGYGWFRNIKTQNWRWDLEKCYGDLGVNCLRCNLGGSGCQFRIHWCNQLSFCQDIGQTPVPLTIFRSNSKFDQSLESSGLIYTRPITKKCATVVKCAKFRCDRMIIF